MSLTTTGEVLQFLKSNAQPNTALYQQIDSLRRAMERAVTKFCKWPLSANSGLGQGNYYAYYDGKNYADVVLRELYVTQILNLWLDPLGNYGQNTSNYTPFGADTLLTNGVDYSLVYEKPGECKSGLVRRLNQNLQLWPSQQYYNSDKVGLSYAAPPFWPPIAGCIKVNYDWGFQLSTPIASVSWAGGIATFTFAAGIVTRPGEGFQVTGDQLWSGDYSVATVASNYQSITCNVASNPGTFTAGFADFVPIDIKCAIAEAVGQMRNEVRYGGQVQNESLGEYNYALSIDKNPRFGEVKQMLSTYRDWSAAVGLF